jgi:hypothetical protein
MRTKTLEETPLKAAARTDASIFSTKKATYVLSPEKHRQDTSKGIYMKHCDAIALETGSARYESNAIVPWARRGMRPIEENFQVRKKPIFYVDLPPRLWTSITKSGSKAMRAGTAAVLVVLPLAFSPWNPPETLLLALPFFGSISGILDSYFSESRLVRETTAYFSLFSFYTESSLRSAAAAEKLEEHLAPALEGAKGEKPSIYVSFGAMHNAIRPYLRHKWLRRSVLNIHKLIPLPFLDRRYLNMVGEVTIKGKPVKFGRVLEQTVAHGYITTISELSQTKR